MPPSRFRSSSAKRTGPPLPTASSHVSSQLPAASAAQLINSAKLASKEHRRSSLPSTALASLTTTSSDGGGALTGGFTITSTSGDRATKPPLQKQPHLPKLPAISRSFNDQPPSEPPASGSTSRSRGVLRGMRHIHQSNAKFRFELLVEGLNMHVARPTSFVIEWVRGPKRTRSRDTFHITPQQNDYIQVNEPLVLIATLFRNSKTAGCYASKESKIQILEVPDRGASQILAECSVDLANYAHTATQGGERVKLPLAPRSTNTSSLDLNNKGIKNIELSISILIGCASLGAVLDDDDDRQSVSGFGPPPSLATEEGQHMRIPPTGDFSLTPSQSVALIARSAHNHAASQATHLPSDILDETEETSASGEVSCEEGSSTLVTGKSLSSVFADLESTLMSPDSEETERSTSTSRPGAAALSPTRPPKAEGRRAGDRGREGSSEVECGLTEDGKTGSPHPNAVMHRRICLLEAALRESHIVLEGVKRSNEASYAGLEARAREETRQLKVMLKTSESELKLRDEEVKELLKQLEELHNDLEKAQTALLAASSTPRSPTPHSTSLTAHATETVGSKVESSQSASRKMVDDSLKKEVETLNRRVTDLSDELKLANEALEGEKVHSSVRLSQLQHSSNAEQQRWATDRANLARQVEERDRTVARMKVDSDEERQRRLKAEREVSELRVRLSRTDDETNGLGDQLRNVQQELIDMTTQHDNLRRTRDVMRAHHAQEIGILQSENKQMDERATAIKVKMETDRAELMSHMKQLESELSELRQSHSTQSTTSARSGQNSLDPDDPQTSLTDGTQQRRVSLGGVSPNTTPRHSEGVYKGFAMEMTQLETELVKTKLALAETALERDKKVDTYRKRCKAMTEQIHTYSLVVSDLEVQLTDLKMKRGGSLPRSSSFVPSFSNRSRTSVTVNAQPKRSDSRMTTHAESVELPTDRAHDTPTGTPAPATPALKGFRIANLRGIVRSKTMSAKSVSHSRRGSRSSKVSEEGGDGRGDVEMSEAGMASNELANVEYPPDNHKSEQTEEDQNKAAMGVEYKTSSHTTDSTSPRPTNPSNSPRRWATGLFSNPLAFVRQQSSTVSPTKGQQSGTQHSSPDAGPCSTPASPHTARAMGLQTDPCWTVPSSETRVTSEGATTALHTEAPPPSASWMPFRHTGIGNPSKGIFNARKKGGRMRKNSTRKSSAAPREGAALETDERDGGDKETDRLNPSSSPKTVVVQQNERGVSEMGETGEKEKTNDKSTQDVSILV
eukprot:GHVN01006299.1.p1 GENE.GHVN01006299.1~~GHVN01006299.1.p1  ORF type:complete len:1254 (-),score=375.93 GHVN01006299.1:277-4038(-)